MRGWPGRARGCWPARAASWPVGCAARPGEWSTGRGSSAGPCGPSPGRWPGAPAIGEARTLAAQARASARGRGAQAKLHAAWRLEELADHCQRIATQIQQRSRGEKIADRLVSLADPDARPIRKGKLGKPNEFGYVAQLAEVTANTRRGARG